MRPTGCTGALEEGGLVLLCSSDRWPGNLLCECFSGPPLASNFASHPFHSFLLCLTMGAALAVPQCLRDAS